MIIAHWNESCKDDIKLIEYSDDKILLKDLEKKENIRFLLCKKCCKKEIENIKNKFITAEYNDNIKISDNITVKFINAGHIPGSASVIFTVGNQKVLFSGDLGSGYSRFNGIFDIPEKVDLIFMEATYADDKNQLSMSQYELFRKDLQSAAASGKTIWIPALSCNRTQKILYELKLMQDNGKLSREMPIYSVSTSANAVTSLYQNEVKKRKTNYQGAISNSWFLEDVYQKGSILPENVKLQRIRNYDAQMILISSSGDMDKGISAMLLPKMLTRKNVFIMIVNYVNLYSNVGLLLQNKRTHSSIKSLAKIKKYDIFSDHIDFYSLPKWLLNQDKNVEIYIIHLSDKNMQNAIKFLKDKGWRRVNGTKIRKSIRYAS
ncbi:MAG: MBL fold metallo-hydrolase [Endomicrobium sp.]|jgi:metallo-beta-lactamase family protein|nr:MBL fold metallo-hydrolase [Endomicrobium sp.]